VLAQRWRTAAAVPANRCLLRRGVVLPADLSTVLSIVPRA
jgi:hypothetical protein